MTKNSGRSTQARSNLEIDAAIARRVASADFAGQLRAEGVTTVALDDRGQIVEHRPDGSTTVVGTI